MSQNRTWKDNAREFAALDRGEGWQFAILVACSVEKAQGVRTSGDRQKCTQDEFARVAGTSSSRVRRYHDAWQEAAVKGWVRDATSLIPTDAHDLTIPEQPWRAKDGGVYDASKTGGQISNTQQIAEKAAKDPAYAARVLRDVAEAAPHSVPSFVQEAVKSSPNVAGAADQALSDKHKEFVAARPIQAEKPGTVRDEQADVVSLVYNLRRVHRHLAEIIPLAQDIPAAVRDKMTEAVREEIDWIRAACDAIDAGLGGDSIDQQLRDLLDAEAGR